MAAKAMDTPEPYLRSGFYRGHTTHAYAPVPRPLVSTFSPPPRPVIRLAGPPSVVLLFSFNLFFPLSLPPLHSLHTARATRPPPRY